jgi:hypothetical protein
MQNIVMGAKRVFAYSRFLHISGLHICGFYCIKNVGRLSPFLIGRERILHAYGHNRNSLGHREIQAG